MKALIVFALIVVGCGEDDGTTKKPSRKAADAVVDVGPVPEDGSWTEQTVSAPEESAGEAGPDDGPPDGVLEAKADEKKPGVQPAPRLTIAQLVDKDFATLSAAAKADTRYLAIAHLMTDLDPVRFGLEKTLNSLSTAPEIAKLTPLDAARTVYRMSLSAFAWKPATFDLLRTDAYAAANIEVTAGGAVLAKGDWLVFAATRPEIYEKILALPPLESMLEARLGIKDRTQATYLGVTTSVVTYGPRVLERIPIRHANGTEGYYWRSFDWLSRASAARAFATVDPVYAPSRSVVDLIAGEFIFSLPNGFQAYMLSGFGTQHRYDALASVARDSRREDKLVINGESCITCHARGLNTRQDEIRPRFEANASAFDAASLARFRKQFPTAAEMDALFAKDNERFRAALDSLGYPQVTGEPIGATVDRFKADRGIRDFRQQRGETDAVLK